MKSPLFASMRALAVVIAIVALASSLVAGQTATTTPTTAKTYDPPRTADGRPDLSGVWSHNAATPFERPKELAGREFLTPTEVANLKQNAAQLFNGDTDAAFGDSVFLAALKNASDYQSRDGQTADTPLGTGNYNHFWLVERAFDNRTSLIVDPADGRLPALTPEAQKSQADAAVYNRLHYADGPEDVPHNCYGGTLPMLGAGYNNYYQIVQSPDSVGLYMEMMHDVRMVPVNGGPPLTSNIRQRLGSSRGHWDGDTFVVETTNFKGSQRGGGGGRGTTETA